MDRDSCAAIIIGESWKRRREEYVRCKAMTFASAERRYG
jgi:hypothetical protein